MTGSEKVNPAAKLENIIPRDKQNMGLVLLNPEDDLQTAPLSDIHVEAGDADAISLIRNEAPALLPNNRPVICRS